MFSNEKILTYKGKRIHAAFGIILSKNNVDRIITRVAECKEKGTTAGVRYACGKYMYVNPIEIGVVQLDLRLYRVTYV